MGSPQDSHTPTNPEESAEDRVKVNGTQPGERDNVSGSQDEFPGLDSSHVDCDTGSASTLEIGEYEKGPPDPKPDPDEAGSSKRKGVRSFLDGVLKDLRNKDLLPLKILFFFKYATLFVLYPFLTLHLKSLGLDATEAGINSALIPVVSIFGPPFSGVIADKIGNFKIFLSGITLINAPLALALLLVPKARETIHLPELMTFSFSCDIPNSPFILRAVDPSTCQLNPSNPLWSDGRSLPPSTLQCGSVCPVDSLRTEDLTLPLAPFTGQGLSASGSRAFLHPDQVSAFVPFTSSRPSLDCDSSGTKCSLGLRAGDSGGLRIPFEANKLRFRRNGAPIPVGITELNVTEPEFQIETAFSFGDSTFNSTPTCFVGEESGIENGTCRTECLVQYNRTLFCSNKEELKVYNVALTFGLYTLVRVLLGIASATSFIMFEGAVLAILKEFGGDYGLQRVSATLAAIIAAPLSGFLIQAFNHFSPAFYLYAVFQLLSALMTLKIDLSFKPPAERILGRLKEVLSQVEILIFFCAMLLSGTAWGYLESFLFWFLQDLGGSNILMGLTITVGGLAGVPLLVCSRPIIKQFGHVNILCLGLLFYAFRLIGYSYIENPWMCLPFEAMEAVTASLAITAAATYAAALSSPQTIASIQGIWGGLYFGFGRGAGSLLGGFFHKWYGARNTFRIFSFMALIGGVLYFIVNMLYIEKYSKHQRKGDGLDLANIKGDRHARENGLKPKGPDSADANDNKYSGYIGPCDTNKFTDVPLDEESPVTKSKFGNQSSITSRGKNKSNGKSIDNSSV